MYFFVDFVFFKLYGRKSVGILIEGVFSNAGAWSGVTVIVLALGLG